MRINFYLILLSIISCCIFSCSKGTIVKDPRFGTIKLLNSSPQLISVVQGNDDKVMAIKDNDSVQVNIPSGTNRFRFYAADTLLVDTLLSAMAYTTVRYTLFKPAANVNLKIFDTRLNGFEKEIAPDSGYVKLSIANFSTSLPDKIDISIETTTYTPYTDKPIQVGSLLNVSGSFSEFHTIMTGIDRSSKVVSVFTLNIKDPSTKLVLATIPLTLPVSQTAGSVGKLLTSVFLLYLDDSGSAKILMSK